MKKPDMCENCTTACAYNSTGTGSCYSYIKQLESRLAQVERERDAAVADLTHVKDCGVCKKFDDRKTCSFIIPCVYGGKKHFEWRGVCPENAKEE